MALFLRVHAIKTSGYTTSNAYTKQAALALIDHARAFLEDGSITVTVKGDATKYDGKNATHRATVKGKLQATAEIVR